jgi:small subunit ribosomal protein S16
MAVKIRLHRQGRKKTAYYFIVVADSRSPRDGRFIERIGSYNPMPKVHQIDVDIDKAIDWLGKGAIPTKTVRSIFSQQGVLYKKHLLRGVKLGILTMEDVDKKFAEYLQTKADSISTKLSKIQSNLDKETKATLEREAKVSELRAKQIMEKRQKAMAKSAAAESGEEEAEEVESEVEETIEETTEVTAEEVTEETTEEATEEVAEEVTEEAEEESAEEATEEATEEAPEEK